MGSLVPIASAALASDPITKNMVVQTVLGGMLEAAGYMQQNQQAQQSAAAQQGQFDQQRALAYQKQALEDKKRQERLRQDLAAQRARFGARGISSGSGSAKAVLTGLEKTAAEETADAHSFLDAQYPQKNLLDASEPKRRSAWNAVSQAAQTVSLLAEQ